MVYDSNGSSFILTSLGELNLHPSRLRIRQLYIILYSLAIIQMTQSIDEDHYIPPAT